MTSTPTAEATPTAQQAFATAAEATKAADAAMVQAAENVTAAERHAAALEAAFIADAPVERPAMEKARAAIERAQADVEWSHIQPAAAEARHRDRTARGGRGAIPAASPPR